MRARNSIAIHIKALFTYAIVIDSKSDSLLNEISNICRYLINKQIH